MELNDFPQRSDKARSELIEKYNTPLSAPKISNQAQIKNFFTGIK